MSKNKYTFHHLGLSHLPLSKEYSSCAFTNKLIKMNKMLTSLGHDVYFYGARTTNSNFDIEKYVDSDNFHFIETHDVSDIASSFGSGDNRFEIGYAWPAGDYIHDFATMDSIATRKFYANTIKHINEIKKPDDFLLCSQGGFHREIAEAVNLFLTCESGIGYRFQGMTTNGRPWFRCFESAYIQNFLRGSEHPLESLNGIWQDVVIGNYFDPDDIEFSAEKDDYYLFCARLIRRKGLVEAYETCKAIGAKLVIAGQGGRITPEGHLICQYPGEFDLPPDGTWEYVGFQSIEKRKHLMARAKALFSITIYLECFAGSHVEAMLSGTPPICSNFGVYGGDTFIPGVHGFRGNSLDDFVFAAKNVHKLDPYAIRKNGERYLMDNIKYEYLKWFDELHNVWESTQDDNKKGWSRIYEETPIWRKKLYPHLFID